jgi:hypothetical protein
MKVYYITFRSVTYAQRGEQILQGEGIRCTLQRTPRWMEQQGCGYYLKLRGEDCSRSIALLREKQVLFRKVYRQRDDALEGEDGR